MQAKGRFKFERIGAPQPADMARVAAERAVEMITEVSDNVVPYFK
jgi:ATP-dependent RNA helicase DDX21